MGRRKKRAPIPFWESPEPSAQHFGRIYPELDKHPAFVGLSFSAKYLYHSMIQVACGNREFHFTVKEYEARGMNHKTFERARDDLIKAGFIEIARNGRTTRQPNIYRFSAAWQERSY